MRIQFSKFYKLTIYLMYYTTVFYHVYISGLMFKPSDMLLLDFPNFDNQFSCANSRGFQNNLVIFTYTLISTKMFVSFYALVKS